MSEERQVLNIPKVGGGTSTIGLSKAKEIADNQGDLSDAEMEAKLTRVLERGIIIDRAHVDLPSDVHGEWVSNDDASIARMDLLGFKIDDKFAVDRSLNSDGTRTPTIGDVIFMTCPIRTKQLIDKVRKKLYDRANPEIGQQREEKLFRERSELPVVDESSVSSASGDEIEKILTDAE